MLWTLPRGAANEYAAPGDPILTLLCETAFDTITDLNHPGSTLNPEPYTLNPDL